MEFTSYQGNAALRELREEIAALRAEIAAINAEREETATRAAETLKAEEEAKANATPQEKYETRVEELIRERYTAGEELAVLRQRDYKPGEFNAYWEYVEKCKVQAKAEVLGVESEPHENIIEEEVL